MEIASLFAGFKVWRDARVPGTATRGQAYEGFRQSAAIPFCAELFSERPVEDDSGANHEIVLVIVGGVREGRRIVVDLNGAECEAGI